MRRFLLVLLLPTAWATAQNPARQFDAASIRLDKSGPEAPNGFFPSPGRLRVTNMSLEQLIHAAWRLRTGTLFGLSGWMQSDRFDLEATTPAGAAFEDELDMLQGLLQNRFQLRFHHETRQMKTLALVPGKGGARVAASSDQKARERIRIVPGEISGTSIPFGHFVSILQSQLGYPIANETALSGNFDLSLRFDLPVDAASLRSPADDASGSASVGAALEEQLGLRLETRHGPVDVFVLDSASHPNEN
ncbi:MAG TPA: TIGR03435 family protein [Bryobacteraceae bacterium]|nr:TIGR03435 family protein [Bryobacteraceae bacterium]